MSVTAVAAGRGRMDADGKWTSIDTTQVQDLARRTGGRFFEAQDADAMDRVLKPKGVAVVIEAVHQCMSARGIRKPEAVTVTSRMIGAFRRNAKTRREFLNLMKWTGGNAA